MTKHNLIETLYRKYFIDLGDYRKTVFLAGVGRSGTTWVGDLINYRNQYRMMFEPFHSEKISQLNHFKYHQYLRAEDRDEKYIRPIETILSGRIRHEWIDKHNRRMISQRRIVKDVRTNLLIYWVKRNFPEIPVILLLRHPCAVANSRLKLGWESRTEVYLSQEELMADYLAPYRSLIEKTEDAFDKHILVWCIQNFVPLNQFRKGEILILYYEYLCVQPEFELKRLFAFLGESYSARAMDAFDVPSALSQKESAVVLGKDRVASWQKEINPMRIQRTLQILSEFGLHHVYGKDPMPQIDSLETLQ